MNQGRIWCVVHPTVGLPLLLGSVAVTALIVHTCILTHTTWFGTYWMGAKARVADNSSTSNAALAAGAALSAPGFSMKVTPVQTAVAGAPASFVITLTPTAPAAVPSKLAAIPAPVRTASAN